VAWSVTVIACAAAAGATPDGEQAPGPTTEDYVRRVAVGACLACTYLCVFGPSMFRRSKHDARKWRNWEARIVESGAIVGGLTAAVLLSVDALDMTVRSSRLLGGGPVWRDAAPASENLLEAGGLAAVAACWLLAVSRDRSLVAALFWLLILAGWWVVLAIAAGARDVLIGLQVVLAVTLASFTIAQGAIRQHRRVRAWPDRLSRLAEGYPDWPAFRGAAVVAALAVLLLGCATLTSWLTAPCAAVAAAAALALNHREWSPNLARLGVALTTVAILAVPMPWFAGGADQELATTLPVQLNVALFGLAWMTFHWYWLALVWDQQRLDGRPWTTAGRLIPVAHRAGFFSGVFGLLVAIQMSTWPRAIVASTSDDTPGRWVAGLAGIIALTGALMIGAVFTQKRSLIGLMVVGVTTGGLFAAVRMGILPGPGAW